MQEKGLKNHTIALMVSTALFFDVLQWLLAFILMDWLVSIFAFLTFFVWFKLYGMKFMTPKRLATMGGAFIIEVVPILAALPAWTGAVVVLILDYKAKKILGAAAQPTFQKGPPLPERPIRPTMEHIRTLNSLKPQLYGNTPAPTAPIDNAQGKQPVEPLRPVDSLVKQPARESEEVVRTSVRPNIIEVRDRAPSQALEAENLPNLPRVGQELEMDDRGRIAEQEIDLDNLVFVRADHFAPKVTNDGVMIENAHDVTQGKIKRLTNHFSLNHRVSSNIGGNWERTPYVFVIPASAMVKENGTPDNLYSVDTFYSKSVALPHSSVIIHEQGKKPELGEYEKKYTLIEVAQESDREKVLSEVIKKMGYTEVEGRDRSVTAKYENFDTALKNYAAKKGLRWGLHEGSWSEAWEDAQSSLEINRPDQALKLFLQIENDPEESRRMPAEIKQSLLRDIFTSADSNQNAKRWIVDKIGDILESDIPDKKVVVDSVPQRFWREIHDTMIGSVGAGEIHSTKEEAETAFQRLFAMPYESITGRKLDVE